MNKKIIISFCMLIAVVNVAFAEDKSYIGGSVGVTDLGYNQIDKVKAGAIGKLFGGYGRMFGDSLKYYLGGELNFDLASYPNHSNINYALGASIIPGLMLTPNTMIYGRLGLQANRFNYSGAQFGNQLGLGVQTKLSKNWDARVEYISVSNISPNRDSQMLVGLVYNFS